MNGLSIDNLSKVPARDRPAYDPRSIQIGILHLGIGSFHRAHQAVYTDDAIASSGDDTWGICGVTQRSSEVRDLLAPQDFLYSVLERDQLSERLRVIGSIRDVISGPSEPERLTAAFAEEAIRIVSLTITEKGYHCDPNGALVVDDAIQSDLDGRRPTTAIGRVAYGLEARRLAGSGSVALMSCDNVPRNGDYLKGAVAQFVERMPPESAVPLAAWIAESVTFPSSVVDRIVPRTSPEGLAIAEGKLGLKDAGAIATEPYKQWVIQGHFPAGRPHWPGVVDTIDIEPYQDQKLRLLNATHSALAYLGAIGDHTSIAQTIAQPAYKKFAAGLMKHDVIPTLQSPDGGSLDAYSESVLERFSNPILAHRCDQVAADGSQKLPIRLLPSARIRIEDDAEPTWICLAVAAWMRFVGGVNDEGRSLRVEDPMAARLMELANETSEPSQIVHRLLSIREIFPIDLAEDDTFRRLVTMWLGRLAEHGADNVLGDTS